MQTFQYKIICRILNCGYNLYKWKLTESPFCVYCRQIDTIEHHLYLCAYSKKFWELFEKWVSKYLSPTLQLTICEIMFGKNIRESDNVTKVINVLINYGKWYINHKRTNEKNLCFFEFTRLCEGKIRTLKYCDESTIERTQNNVFETFDSIKFDIEVTDLT